MYEELSAAVEDNFFHRSTSIRSLPFGLPTTFHGGSSSSSSPSSSSSLAPFDQHRIWWEREEEYNFGNGIRPWSQEELLCMMKIRSCFDNWFPPYFIWDHVSRKLHEEGFHRSAVECRCKFEERENNAYSHGFKVSIQGEEQIQKADEGLKEDGMMVGGGVRGEKFEMVKGMCEKVVRTLMEMQERMMEEMLRRDAEETQREEAFMKQEMDKVEMEMEIREKERIVAEDRNSAIIKLLKKFQHSSFSSITDDLLNLFQTPQLCSAPSKEAIIVTPTSSVEGGGKEGRWRREEVMALINQRCGGGGGSRMRRRGEGCTTRGGEPLWEKVSRKMMEMGYRRSSKRCKEKWENINKYFRKTREVGRKRAVGSTTCPYFHHLTALYNGSGGGGGGGGPVLTEIPLQTPPSAEEACKLEVNERCVGGGGTSLCSCCWCVEEDERG